MLADSTVTVSGNTASTSPPPGHPQPSSVAAAAAAAAATAAGIPTSGAPGGFVPPPFLLPGHPAAAAAARGLMMNPAAYLAQLGGAGAAPFLYGNNALRYQSRQDQTVSLCLCLCVCALQVVTITSTDRQLRSNCPQVWTCCVQTDLPAHVPAHSLTLSHSLTRIITTPPSLSA